MLITVLGLYGENWHDGYIGWKFKGRVTADTPQYKDAYTVNSAWCSCLALHFKFSII